MIIFYYLYLIFIYIYIVRLYLIVRFDVRRKFQSKQGPSPRRGRGTPPRTPPRAPHRMIMHVDGPALACNPEHAAAGFSPSSPLWGLGPPETTFRVHGGMPQPHATTHQVPYAISAMDSTSTNILDPTSPSPCSG